MPSIFTSTKEITNFPNKFISPFGDDPIVPLFSSIPFKTESDCLPCAICGNNSTRNNILKTQAEKFSNYNQNKIDGEDVSVGISYSCWLDWTPPASTICFGTPFQQSRSNVCTGESENRSSTGTSEPNWSAWSPDASTVCLGTSFQQSRTDLNEKCGSQTQNATGTSAPNWSAWSPDASTVCLGTSFQQSRTDLNGKCPSQTQQATGTSAPNWSAWSPDVSTICSGIVFQQSRTDLNGKCGSQTQNATGTKNCNTLSVLFARFD